MTFEDLLASYHKLEPHADFKNIFLKAGVRHYPELHPGISMLLDYVPESETLLDATNSAAAFTQLHAKSKQTIILESSYAHLRCARQNLTGIKNTDLSAGALWEMPPNHFDCVVTLPATDKGTARVIADMNGVQQTLKPTGQAYFVMHKDQGAKRYEKHLGTLFTKVEVLAKQQGWRLVKASQKKEHKNTYTTLEFEVSQLSLKTAPGVYAAGKLDPGTAFMLESVDLNLRDKHVLDLGCGYGLLALKASLEGANVTALDDDILAVQSTYKNAQTYALDIRCLHSDINSELNENDQFDVVLTNPPFHIGKFVKLELSFAFIAAAHKQLVKGGELIMVANKALKYEPLLADFTQWETLATNKSFKVLRAIK